MFWQSIMVDRWLELDVIQVALSDVFGLPPSRVQVVTDVAAMSGPILPEPRILAECTRRDGGFPLQLDVFLAADEIEQAAVPLDGALRYARALARHLNVTMLLGDGPIGHDEQLRVAPDGTVDIVELDGDEMDDERFVIVGSRPFVELPAEATRAGISA
jgi:hypothetical protein